jgi:hypothetical protein
VSAYTNLSARAVARAVGLELSRSTFLPSLRMCNVYKSARLVRAVDTTLALKFVYDLDGKKAALTSISNDISL